ACNRAYGHALVHAHRAGDWRSVADITTRIGVGYMFGPEPVDEGLRWLGAQEAQLRGQPVLIGLRAMLEATRGRFREARALLAEARARNQELGARGVEALQAEAAWIVESYADDHGAAEQAIRAGCRLLEETGASGFLATQAAELACTLCALENDEEAEEWARRSAALAASDDVWTQMLWRQALARVAARRGQLAEAERLAREAVALGGETDLLTAVGDALTVLAAVLRLAGRQREAAAQAKRALGLYERKGNTVMAAQARRISDPVKLHLAPQSPVGAETSEPR
ncbi:MAG TPA: tetratricopeptide repeat protein, partial [Gaiellaceae bacterium]|nr:tetratricopeptide repeat protein [Gaiellaceae bacterium]